jgi:hypothetical protein
MSVSCIASFSWSGRESPSGGLAFCRTDAGIDLPEQLILTEPTGGGEPGWKAATATQGRWDADRPIPEERDDLAEQFGADATLMWMTQNL